MGAELTLSADEIEDGDTVRWVFDDSWKGYIGKVTGTTHAGVYLRLRTTKLDRFVARAEVPLKLKVLR